MALGFVCLFFFFSQKTEFVFITSFLKVFGGCFLFLLLFLLPLGFPLSCPLTLFLALSLAAAPDISLNHSSLADSFKIFITLDV